MIKQDSSGPVIEVNRVVSNDIGQLRSYYSALSHTLTKNDGIRSFHHGIESIVFFIFNLNT